MTGDGAGGTGPVGCAWCGAVATDGVPLDWVRQTDERGRLEYLCARCARENLRSIEARLDTAWW